MILLSAQNISKTYMERKVLDNASFFLNEGDRVGIIGINGTGKSTLLKILAGAEEADSGEIVRTKDIRISYLPQIPEFDDHSSILEQVMHHLPTDLRAAKEFEAKAILGKFGISDFSRDIASLSGGERRRAGIAAALIQPSDILLLDEPTNHIDNETVVMLEEQLKKYRGAIVMVTHDRYFLNCITSRIVEVDKGRLYDHKGSYAEFLEYKAQRETDAIAKERRNSSLYRQELEWIRRGVRARGTKSKDRIERFHELENREKPIETESLQLQSVSSRLGKKTIELYSVSKSIDGKNLIRDFSCMLPRDARVGIVGRNGAGKSTLLRMIVGEISPDSGEIIHGDTVVIGYFSQQCENMNDSLRVIEYIRETADYIRTPDGVVTASQMLERFLFTPELQWSRIEKLSGGERKRLFLLKILMTAPNILLLDEPTNDLDIATLTILEDYLQNFRGAVVAVSHDRYFLDKISSEIWEMNGNGEIKEYNGNYSDYAKKSAQNRNLENVPEKIRRDKKKPAFIGKTRLKFSFKEQREFETIDDDIAELEEKIALADRELAENSSDYVKLQELTELKGDLSLQLEEKMDRWVYLNDLAERIANGEMV